jgi:hypothetical protein
MNEKVLMQKITPVVCFASRHSVGATFLNWSYHWLAGHREHWKNKKGWVNVPDNPNTGINAHHFAKNYHAGHAECQLHLEQYQALGHSQPVSFYAGGAVTGTRDEVDADFARAFNTISTQIPTVLLVESAEDPWYFLKQRALNPADQNQISSQDQTDYQQQLLNNIINTYFSSDFATMDKNIWDIRELLALNFEHINPVDNSNYRALLDLSNAHVYVDSRELWLDGESCVVRVMSSLGQAIQQDRLPQWRLAYQEWQTSQLDIIKFGWYLPHIVDSIVKGNSFDFSHLKINLLCESVIQGMLIKNHNLNLRCYGLEKFPANTRDLHHLLEQNTHSV